MLRGNVHGPGTFKSNGPCFISFICLFVRSFVQLTHSSLIHSFILAYTHASMRTCIHYIYFIIIHIWSPNCMTTIWVLGGLGVLGGDERVLALHFILLVKGAWQVPGVQPTPQQAKTSTAILKGTSKTSGASPGSLNWLQQHHQCSPSDRSLQTVRMPSPRQASQHQRPQWGLLPWAPDHPPNPRKGVDPPTHPRPSIRPKLIENIFSGPAFGDGRQALGQHPTRAVQKKTSPSTFNKNHKTNGGEKGPI